eukprot:scaffold70925_cov30-Phaeocystis_antarctica.AAC.1
MRYRPEQDFGSQPGAKGSLAGGNLTDAQTCVPKEATKKFGQPARAEERRSDALADEPTSARGKSMQLSAKGHCPRPVSDPTVVPTNHPTTTTCVEGYTPRG